ESQMREIAEATRGAFFAATDPDLMVGIYAEIDRLAPVAADEAGAAPIQDLRWAPLLVGLIAVLIVGWREYRDP
ncbi:MAG: VWA domain-containing protein, partial [Pseudomonadota bacterium]